MELSQDLKYEIGNYVNECLEYIWKVYDITPTYKVCKDIAIKKYPIEIVDQIKPNEMHKLWTMYQPQQIIN